MSNWRDKCLSTQKYLDAHNRLTSSAHMYMCICQQERRHKNFGTYTEAKCRQSSHYFFSHTNP